MRQPISILVYPVRRYDEHWQYLFLRRIARPDLGLDVYWQGVTGGLEESESPAQAARRELSEETGFLSASLRKIDYSYSFTIEDKWKKMYPLGVDTIIEYVFIASIDGHTEPTLSHEHDRWEWCCADIAMGKLKYPGNIEALRRCAILLESRPSSK